ncbi:ketose-bisphosphate aldolase [Limtongia smithiae]|uniref:ketose-bisphosphate aldolase n=1 Tax=Limtongia smithiae TaxID=1125753 RepID=UPI0034CE1E8A
MAFFPQSNLTWKILNDAEAGGYAVPAFNCYNQDAIMGAIKAAENLKAPAIIEIFPWSIHTQGEAFVRYAADAAHSAKVPIALHLDHCIEEADIYIALELPFDSIMVDASSQDPEENVKFVKKIVDIATTKGITIEAEMGRIQGGEDGLPTVDMEALYTEPELAADFVARTGVHFLAPSFGNVHGPYPPGGPEKYWQLDRVAKIKELSPPSVRLVLHGTNPIFVPLIESVISNGVRKVNMNKNLYVKYRKFMADNIEQMEMTKLQDGAVAAMAEDCEWGLKLVHADGKAT